MRRLFTVTLYLVVLELWLTGALCLLAPRLAARLWNYPLKDEALVRVLGPPWIVIGLMWFIMARDLDRYRRVIWVPILGTFLQLARAVAGLWSGELATDVARPQIISEGGLGILLLVGYWGAYRRGRSD